MGSDHARRGEFAVSLALEGGVPDPSVALTTHLEILLSVGRRGPRAAGGEQRYSQREPHGEPRHGAATLGARSAACQAAVCSAPRARRVRSMTERGGDERARRARRAASLTMAALALGMVAILGAALAGPIHRLGFLGARWSLGLFGVAAL